MACSHHMHRKAERLNCFMSFYCLHHIKKSHSRKYVCMFSLQQGLALFCQTVDECWDLDPEARLTADCAQTRLQELLLTSKSAWQLRLCSHVHFMHLGVASTPRQLKTRGFRYQGGVWKGSPKGTGKNEPKLKTWTSYIANHVWPIAWISSDYFQSLLLLQLLRGENDSKQSDEFQASMAEWRSTKNNTRHTSGNSMETKTDQSTL